MDKRTSSTNGDGSFSVFISLSPYRWQIAMLKKIIGGLVVTVFVLCVPGIQLAQEAKPILDDAAPPIPLRLLHEFRDETDELLGVGQFVKLEGATVTIRDANNVVSTLKMRDLCQEDKRWVNRQVSKQKKNERLAEDAAQVWLAVDKDKPRSVVKGCNKLKSFGRAAIQQSAKVRTLFSIEDKSAKRAALSAYAHICQLDFQNLKILVNAVTTNRFGEHDVVMDRPGPFLEGIASMDYLGLVYLSHVAFTCDLKAESGWLETDSEPVKLKFLNGPEHSLRLAAVEAIGELKGEEAATVLLDLAAVVEAPVNGKRDDAMLSAWLKAFGTVGVNNGEVLAILDRHEKDFPKITAKALEQIREK